MKNNLTDKLQNIFKNLKRKGFITEDDLNETLKEIKLTLLESDVSFKVTKEFIKNIKEKTIGTDVLNGLNPSQTIIKIVKDEMISLMGTNPIELTTKNNNSITIFMMIGLNGAGKTTTSTKLAVKFKNKGKKPLLVACDIYRPAAIEQLKINATKNNIDFFEEGTQNPLITIKHSIEYAKRNGHNLIILDTAGRLQIDELLMNELKEIKNNIEIDKTILVLDAMTGQEAINIAKTFNDEIFIDGIILSKMDGDAKGGAALSIKSLLDKPIYYVGMGEKVSDLEQFYPDRMANRILGMGDVLTLIDKISEENINEEIKIQDKEDFDLDDYLEAFKQMKKLGGFSSILSFLPNMGNLDLSSIQVDENKIKRTEAIILSMTKEERKNPQILNGSRRKRIALGAGVNVSDVNILIKTYNQSKDMMKQILKNSKKTNKKGIFPFF